MKIQTFYPKLYLYILGILFISIALTVGAMYLFIQYQEKERRQLLEHQEKEQRIVHNNLFSIVATFIQKELNQAYSREPESIKAKIEELSRRFNCSIAYWKVNQLKTYAGMIPEPISPELLHRLSQQRTPQIFSRFPMKLLLYLDEKNPDKGYLVIRYPFTTRPGVFREQFQRRTAVPIFFVMVFLAILVLPFSIYLFKPLNEMMTAIRYISQGDLSKPIHISKNSEFHTIAGAFNHMREKIQDMLDQKQRLIADVSHELRSPLARVRVGLEILAKDPVGRQHHIKTLIANIEQLDEMIAELLEMSRLELDAQSLKLEPVDLSQFVLETIQQHHLLFENQQLQIKTDFPVGTLVVNLDQSLMKRVLSNLFSNLLKFAPTGSGVDITLQDRKETILLIVRDRGPGIPQEALDKIFDPFYRTDASRDRETGGTGLGLSIARKIVEAHGGRIEAALPEDQEGGVQFMISLGRLASANS